jgi:hypothetical protein
MTERWVNARIEIVVALDDVTTESTDLEKQEASGKVLARLSDAMPTDLVPVMSARWEDVEEGDEFACVDDYPEHDYELFDEADGDTVYHCRRCGAELIETADMPASEETR